MTKRLTTSEAAEYLRTTPGTLSVWRHEKIGPPFIKMGKGKNGKVLYLESDLEAWLGKNREEVGNVSDNGH